MKSQHVKDTGKTNIRRESESKGNETEKLKKCLKKAKTKIEDLQKHAVSRDSVNMQAKVVEKDQIIEMMKKEMKQKRILREHKMVTACYKVGIAD